MITENILELLFKVVGVLDSKYNFSFDNKIEKDDILFNKAVIDKQSLDIIAGSIVDFKKEMIESRFQ